MASYSAVLMIGVKPEKLFTREEKTEVVTRYNEITGEPYKKELRSYEFTFMGRKLTEEESKELGVNEDFGVPDECSFLPGDLQFAWARYGNAPAFDPFSEEFLIGKTFSVNYSADFNCAEIQGWFEEISNELNVSPKDIVVRLTLDRQ